MSGCPRFEEAIALHAAGGLDGREREALERHLAACPACAAELAETGALLAEVAEGAPALPPDREAAFAARVRAAAEELRDAPIALDERRPRRRLAVRVVAGAGALAAAASLALALWTAPTGPSAGTAGLDATRAEEALAADVAALAATDAEATDLVPEPDAGFGVDGLSDDELEALDTLLASKGG